MRKEYIKRTMKKAILILFLLLLLPSFASAIEFTQTGAIVTAKYTEPTTNADGSPLTDLDHCSLYYNEGSGDVKAKDIPATSVNGGGNVETTFEVPISIGQEKTFQFWATASDDSGNESEKSNIVTLTIDRLAPGAPQ